MRSGPQDRMIYGGTAFLCLTAATVSFLLSNRPLTPPAQSCYFVSQFGFPCAGCGGSHALQAMIRGNGLKSFFYNPLVAVLLLLILVLGGLMVFDLVSNKRILVRGFKRVMNGLKNRKVSLGLAALLVVHWTYVIFKYFNG
jgi:hypothetical protein